MTSAPAYAVYNPHDMPEHMLPIIVIDPRADLHKTFREHYPDGYRVKRAEAETSALPSPEREGGE